MSLFLSSGPFHGITVNFLAYKNSNKVNPPLQKYFSTKRPNFQQIGIKKGVPRLAEPQSQKIAWSGTERRNDTKHTKVSANVEINTFELFLY